ncbi:MAG: DHA1 family tetracycline resistance protein-like MFS transporter [Pirellulaceae bacterium]|jgi:DHA1 family tetracycline resistance protein-like MFS transporter
MTKPSNTPKTAAIAFILLTLFIDILGIGIIIPVLPELVKQFVGDSSAAKYYGIIAASYAFMQFIFAPILGALSDRFGRRPVILISLFGLGVDFLVLGFAPDIRWLFAGRVFGGIMGASFSTANAYIADISTPQTRGRNYGFVGMMFGLGFTIGPALGGFLGGFDLRLPFFVAAGLALVNWLYGFFVLPESLPPEKRSSFTLSKANPFGALKHLRAYPIVAGLAVAFVFTSLAQRGLENVWILFTGFQFGWSRQTNGYVLALVGITAAIVQGGCVRPLIKKFGERGTVILGLSVNVVAFFCYGLATKDWMIPCIIAFGAFGGVAGPAIQSIIAGAVNSSEQGKVQGALTSLMSLTNIAAPLIFTTGLFHYFTSDRAPFKLAGAPFLLGSLLIFIALLVVLQLFRRIPIDVTAIATDDADSPIAE